MGSNAMNSKDIVVVGAGIVGLSVALKLFTDGYKVTIIDAKMPMNGCSAGNAGFLSESNIFPPATSDIILKLPKLLLAKEGPLVIAPGYLSKMIPWTIKAAATLNRRRYAKTVEAFATLITRSQCSLSKLAKMAKAERYLSKEGGLVCFLTQEAFESRKKSIPVWRSKGIAVKSLSAEQTRELEPEITEKVIGSIFFENSGRCSDPKGLGLAYFDYLMNQGVDFVNEGAVKITAEESDRWSVVTTKRSINTSNVVLCAGYYTDPLLKPFGYGSNVVSERGYHLMIPEPKVNLNRPVVFGEPYFAATPMDNGLRLAGTAEFNHPDKPKKLSRAYMLKDLAQRYLPNLSALNAVPWMGIRPTLPDGLPAIGAVKYKKGLFYAFGHGHNGLMTSGITAECIAALVQGTATPVDMVPFDLQRFNN